MKEIFKTTTVKIFLSVVLILIMLAVFSQNTGYNFLSSAFETVTSGLSQVSAKATDKNIKKSYDELLKENEKLKKSNEQYRAQLIDYYDTKTENTRLWKFYNLKKEHPEYTLIPATVVKRDPNSDFYSFTVDKGTSSSVEVNDPVVTDNGLVGWVSEVSKNTCKVVTILSPQTSISAQSIKKTSKSIGVLTGDLKYSDDNRATLTKLEKNNKLKKGEILITTGISGLYPKNLVVGEVKKIKYDSFDNSFYAVVEPYDDIRKLTQVAIITDFVDQGEVLIPGDDYSYAE